MDEQSFYHSAGGIDWYCELRGKGDVVVLIPSGEGDCGNFKIVAEQLAQRFAVLTFDTPGFSRTSAPSLPEELCLPKLADQIASLLRSLDLGPATVYGCSSGGRAVLDLVAHHPDLVRTAVVHEVALPSPFIDEILKPLAMLDDQEIIAACQNAFANTMNEDRSAWDALGAEYHERLARNYVTWVHRYIALDMGEPVNPTLLRHRPIVWTIGALSQPGVFDNNIALAQEAGIPIATLPCRHFPQVTIADRLATHIATAASSDAGRR